MSNCHNCPPEIERLTAENARLRSALENAVAHWGDYSPRGGKARKTLDECKALLRSLNPTPTAKGGEGE
jgi:hypothetical protein